MSGADTPAKRQSRKPAVSSRKIAELAGVSQATVSRVFAGNDRVAPEIRERVLAVAREAGYVPNLVARSLVTNRSASIGLVVSNITNPFYPELIEEICSIASKHGLGVILCNTQQDRQRQREALSLLQQHRVDGLIVTSVMVDSPYVKELIGNGMPIVLVNRYLPGTACDMVLIDNQEGAATAVRHLAGLGHRHIAYVQGVRDTTTNRDRQRGYTAALQALELDRSRSYIIPGDFTAASTARAVETLLKLNPRPTAVLCADDETALGVIDHLLIRGLRVPGDMAVIGFDDIRIAGNAAIALTTIRQPVATMAQLAMTMLLERIENNDVARPRRIVLPAELVVRRTCGAPVPIVVSAQSKIAR